MPWNNAQHRLFEAAAHSPVVAARVGIPMQKAQGLAAEGVKTGAAISPIRDDPRRVAMVRMLRGAR